MRKFDMDKARGDLIIFKMYALSLEDDLDRSTLGTVYRYFSEDDLLYMYEHRIYATLTLGTDEMLLRSILYQAVQHMKRRAKEERNREMFDGMTIRIYERKGGKAELVSEGVYHMDDKGHDRDLRSLGQGQLDELQGILRREPDAWSYIKNF